MARESNWSGNISYTPARIQRPESLPQLQSLVANAHSIHALGSRHSFNTIADSAELVSLEAMPRSIELDTTGRKVAVGGGVTYGELARFLEREGFALHNMASLPHISVAGAISTGTHGSGVTHGCLSTAVCGLELVTSDGEVLELSRNDEDFAGMVVGLGALGVVTTLPLDIEASYWMRQQMFDDLDWDVLYTHFDEIMSSAYSVSLFTDFGATVGRVLRKERIDPDDPPTLPMTFHGAPAAQDQQHPHAALAGDNCTEQRGVPGKWLDRLPHFRLDAQPSIGDEIQSEYMVARSDACAALKAMRDIAPLIQSALHVSELRRVAADDLWLSMAYRREPVCLHFSWKLDPPAVNEALKHVEEALAPFEARPHWGKLFLTERDTLDSRYEKLPEFRLLADRLDPRGAFRNAFLQHDMFAE
jgi:xylitol oxidase